MFWSIADKTGDLAAGISLFIDFKSPLVICIPPLLGDISEARLKFIRDRVSAKLRRSRLSH
jgi:hypothetical protein